MDISVIIVSWNVRDLLEACLTSIFEHTTGVSFEVIVVDNHSTDNTSEMVSQSFPGVKLVQLAQNRGFAAANNIGIAEASGAYILLLNPDTRFTENSLAAITQFMRTHTTAGIAGCRLRNPDFSTQHSVRRFPRFRDIAVMLSKLHKIFPHTLNRYLMHDFDYNRAQLVDQVMGAFFCINRHAITQCGGLNEEYFIWFEEVDFCRAVARAGYEVHYWPGTSVIHYGGQSFAQCGTMKKQ